MRALPLHSWGAESIGDGYRYARNATVVEPDALGGALREVDTAPMHVRSTIVDSHYHRASGAEVGHLHARPERQVSRRGGKVIAAVDFAARGMLADKAGSVP